jgi:hypothetical protein
VIIIAICFLPELIVFLRFWGEGNKSSIDIDINENDLSFASYYLELFIWQWLKQYYQLNMHSFSTFWLHLVVLP